MSPLSKVEMSPWEERQKGDERRGVVRDEPQRAGTVASRTEVCEGQLTQRQASERLGVGVRQVKRLCRCVREENAAGLVSKRRGRPSNHQLDPELKSQILELVRLHYADFGPTLASEKLQERHGLTLSKETLRLWMIAEDDSRRSVASPAS